MASIDKELQEFDSDLQSPEVRTVLHLSALRHGRKALHILAQLIWGQGAVQAVNLAASVFLLHRLSVESYAQFGLALGFQNVFSILMDMGFAGTIVPLVADKRDDKALVGRYVRAANRLRNRSFFLLSPIAAVLFLGVAYKHHWDLSVQLILLASILLSLYAGGTMANYSAPLIMFRRLNEYYLPQAIVGGVRLLVYLVITAVSSLSAGVAAGLNAVSAACIAWSVRRRCASLISLPAHDDAETGREVWRYILPASPAIIFAAFQVQISLFLVSVFGGTLYIAQIAALGRIGQIFTLLIGMSGVLVEPYVARLGKSHLLRTYLAFVALAIVSCSPLVISAFFWPTPWLLLIGAKYRAVAPVLGWYVLSMCMNLVSSVVWIMNRARKWVFWSGSILEVVLVLGIQTTFLLLVGVRTTHQAVFFGFAASFGYAVAHGYVAVQGFWQDSHVGIAAPKAASVA